ncbi:MAG: 50S ribosomal protein L25 [Planctomycetota bacterium]
MQEAVLSAEVREQTGTAASRRSRRAGNVPAVVYGHQEGPVAVVLKSEDVQRVVSHRIKMVKLSVGGKVDQMLVKDVQFGVFGDEILHIDFERVAMDELIEVECPVELTGTAKGAAAGGVLEHPTSDLHISCLPANIPESVKISVSDLAIGDSIAVKDIKAPNGVTILTDPEAILVTIRPPLKVEEEVAPAEEEAAAAAAEEPEVIGRKKAEGEKEAEGSD